jgi:hypothetical protein
MQPWQPIAEWQGQDACLVGGGSSLANFKWDLLLNQNTIGCNDAYRLGPEIIKYCVFGDASWFHKNKAELEKFTGKIVTNAPTLQHLRLDWLHHMQRIRDGLHNGFVLGWNYSTGAAAINLAVTLGASRIFLLGFDLGAGRTGKSHWHNHRETPPKESSYQRFLRGFQMINTHLKRYPGVKVFNVTDGTSNLKVFPSIDFETFEREIEQQPYADRLHVGQMEGVLA